MVVGGTSRCLCPGDRMGLLTAGNTLEGARADGQVAIAVEARFKIIRFTQGDILRADVEALVNTVNCVGVMGRGIALQFKKAYPENFRAYAAACKLGEVEPGRVFVFETSRLTNPRYIINFPTRRHWRGKSRIEDIEDGLRALSSEVSARGIRAIAVPPLGSGLGGLDWSSCQPCTGWQRKKGQRAWRPSNARRTPGETESAGSRRPRSIWRRNG